MDILKGSHEHNAANLTGISRKVKYNLNIEFDNIQESITIKI